MFPRGAGVLVAFSGGPDSMALLHIMQALARRGELVVSGVAHLNHQLRGVEADLDEQFCRDIAAEQGLPIDVGRADIAAIARSSGRSVEDTARAVRYEFLGQALDRLGAEVIAVGHSLDDQAETFLLRLLRGAGTRGLGGIRPRAGKVVRPLLEVSRAELRRYADEHQLRFRIDASNEDVRIPRNRVRHRLMPVLEECAPAIARVLAREAEVARQDEEYLEGRAIELAGSHVLRTERGVEIDRAALAALPPALSSRVVRQALVATAPGRFFGFDHIQRVLDLAGAVGGGGEASVSLPGQVAVRRGGKVVLGALPAEPFANFFRLPLSIPGEVAHGGWRVSARAVDEPVGLAGHPARGHEALVARAHVRGPLAVRNRRPGDRFKPLGMGGRGRKLQDFLVDRKIARAERDHLPLVVDEDDRIVWVVGQSVGEDFRVTEPSQGVILLKARRLGGVD